MTTFDEQFYQSENGWFRREGDFVRPCPVLAEADMPKTSQTSEGRVANDGEARESTTAPLAITACAATTATGRQEHSLRRAHTFPKGRRTIQPVAAISGKGRWG